MTSGWFETVAAAQRRAKKRLPRSVYLSLIGGAEKGVTYVDNMAAFSELAFATRIGKSVPKREMSTEVMGQQISLPVIISPTGVQAIHPEAELAVARAAKSHGTVMSLSSFASKPIEAVVQENPETLFQMYWDGTRDTMIQRMDRAHEAGAKGLIATLDWSFSMGRDWGSPWIPSKLSLKSAMRFAPQAITHPAWLWSYLKAFTLPDLTVPNVAKPGKEPPTFFGAMGEWQKTPPASWEDIRWMREQWGEPFMLKGITNVDDAKRAVDIGATTISVSNHGGNNLDGEPATIRRLPAIADAVGDQVEVLLDGGVRRGGDVARALALGAKAVMIGRASLWGLSANGQKGVENVFDILRSDLDSVLLGLGHSSIHDLTADDLIVPPHFSDRLSVKSDSGRRTVKY